jgi:hypothetical protein
MPAPETIYDHDIGPNGHRPSAYDWLTVCGLVIDDTLSELFTDETLPAFTIWRRPFDGGPLILLRDNRKDRP